MIDILRIVKIWLVALAAMAASYIALQVTGAIMWFPPMGVALFLCGVITWGFIKTIAAI
jgi:hypothetical protein